LLNLQGKKAGSPKWPRPIYDANPSVSSGFSMFSAAMNRAALGGGFAYSCQFFEEGIFVLPH